MNRKLTKILDIAVGGTLLLSAGLVAAISFGVSASDYKKYEEQYNAEVAELEKQKPVLPKSVDIDNNFVTYDKNKDFVIETRSKYPNIKTIRSTEALFAGNVDGDIKYEVYDTTSSLGKSIGGFDSTQGGYLEFNINTSEYADGDIDIVLSSANWNDEIGGNTPTNNLAQYIQIKFDNMVVDMGNIDLICTDKDNWFEFQHLILHDLHFKKGLNTLRISSIDGAPKTIFPNMSHIHVFSEKPYSEELTVNGDTMLLINRNNKTYLAFSGQCVGYEASTIRMDLCPDQGVDQIPSSGIQIRVFNNNFVMLVDLTVLPKSTYMYAHFLLNGEPYDSGRVEGDILTRAFADKYNDWGNPSVLQTLGDYELICRNALMTINCK